MYLGHTGFIVCVINNIMIKLMTLTRNYSIEFILSGFEISNNNLGYWK